MIERSMPRLAVVAYDEIGVGVDIEPVETVTVETAAYIGGQQPVGV